MNARPHLIGLDRDELAATLAALGEPPRARPMRVRQLWHWLYYRGARSFAEMTSISTDLRARLTERCDIDRPQVSAEQVSTDGTAKWLADQTTKAIHGRTPHTGPVWCKGKWCS